MTRVDWEARTLERYSGALESGLCSVEEIAGAVLGTLADSGDPAALWAVAPVSLRQKVRDQVAAIGPDTWQAAGLIGNDSQEAQAARTVKQRVIAARLLTNFA